MKLWGPRDLELDPTNSQIKSIRFYGVIASAMTPRDSQIKIKSRCLIKDFGRSFLRLNHALARPVRSHHTPILPFGSMASGKATSTACSRSKGPR